MKTVDISTGYIPRPQQAILHKEMRRFNVIVAHRRMGKTIMTINEAIDRGLRNELKHPRYAYIAPFRDQAKKVAWDVGFKEFTKNLPNVSVNEAELRVDIARPQGDTLRFQLFGAENPDALLGLYFDGVILDEYAVMESHIWNVVVRPTLSDRKGWAIFIGTPRGKNRFYSMYNFARAEMKLEGSEWYANRFKASETGIIDKKELASLRKEMGESLFLQEYETDFLIGNKGAFYAHLITQAEETGKVRRIPHQEGHPVYTAWDLGISDSMAVWFYQLVGKEIHIIDYVENRDGGMPETLKLLSEGERSRYLYHTHYLPHDAKQREIGSGKTRAAKLLEFKKGYVEILDRHDLQDGIHEVKMVLPRCYFDEDRTELGRQRLKDYTKKYDRKTETYLAQPLHNEASNGADAFRSLAMGLREELGEDIEDEPFAVTEYDPFGYGR